jgi:hypothetical protein
MTRLCRSTRRTVRRDDKTTCSRSPSAMPSRPTPSRSGARSLLPASGCSRGERLCVRGGGSGCGWGRGARAAAAAQQAGSSSRDSSSRLRSSCSWGGGGRQQAAAARSSSRRRLRQATPVRAACVRRACVWRACGARTRASAGAAPRRRSRFYSFTVTLPVGREIKGERVQARVYRSEHGPSSEQEAIRVGAIRARDPEFDPGQTVVTQSLAATFMKVELLKYFLRC